jgi:TPP-dependent 2-oxoacid decarboxylase
LKAAHPNGGTNALKIAERFVTGRDVPVNAINAWVWFNLAEQHGAPEGAVKARAIEQKLSPADLAEARKELGQLKDLLDAAWQAIGNTRSGAK